MTGHVAPWLPQAGSFPALLIAAGLATALCLQAAHPGALAQGAPPGAAQAVAVSAEQDRLTQPQLEQLLAPIALYPDDLLMQALMAATYPLEVVQAKRWLGQGRNASLRGEALAQALNGQPWDPSVKSLVPFPDVLTLMNDQLDWTQQLGDAVLAQQQDVLNAVQVLRGRAQAAGALQSGPQQTVNVTPIVNVTPAPDAAVAPPPQVISIAPTQPERVYVPAYDPSVVYGSWPYPAHPPTYYPPPVGWGVGNAILTGMAFAGGVAVVNSLWGWASPGWGRGDVDIDVNRFNNINVNRTQISGNRWRHDESHRHGVAYRDQEVRNTFRGGASGFSGDRAQAREQFRGRVQQAERGEGIGARRPDGDRQGIADRRPGAGGDRPGLGDRRPGGEGGRAGLADRRPEGGRDRPNLAERRGQGGAGAERPAIQHRQSGRPQTRQVAAHHAPQGLQGVGHGRQERAAAERGRASRQGQPAARARAHQRAAAHDGGGAGGWGGRAAAHRGGGGRHR